VVQYGAAAVQPPLAAVHKPTPMVVGGDASNHRAVPSIQPPPLPARNATSSSSITGDSPYVMMYPLRPPRNHPPPSTTITAAARHRTK